MNALELQVGKLVEGGLAVRVIMARIGGHAAGMQLERMVMAVKRLVIRKGMKMHAEPLHHQERQHETPHQRAMAQGSEQAGRKHAESLCDFRQVVQAGGVFVDTPTDTPWYDNGRCGLYRIRLPSCGSKTVQQTALEEAVLAKVALDMKSKAFVDQLTLETKRYVQAHRDDPTTKLKQPVAQLLKGVIEQMQGIRQEALKDMLGNLLDQVELNPDTLACRLHYRIEVESWDKVAVPKGIARPIPGPRRFAASVAMLRCPGSLPAILVEYEGSNRLRNAK